MQTRSPLLSRADAAAYLGVLPQTLSVWGMKGYGPPRIRVGKLVRFRQCDLDKWLVKQTTWETEATPCQQ